MIIVCGSLHLVPGQRDTFITRSLPAIRAAREAQGCLDFSVSPDPLDPDRANVLERWENRAALLLFRGSGPDDDLSELIAGYRIREFDIAP